MNRRVPRRKSAYKESAVNPEAESVRTDHDEPGSTDCAAPAARAGQPRVEVELAGQSHPGKRRDNNEDHFLIARMDRTWHTIMSNLPPRAVPDMATDTAYGLLVADGMGGQAAGEVASRTAITTFVDLILETPDLILRPDPTLTEEALHRIEDRFRRITDALNDLVRRDPALRGMGTTMTLACAIGTELLVAHVGDSRAYLLRNGALRPLTRDQTMAQLMADTGLIAPAEVASHPLRNVLTSAVGTSGTDMDVDLGELRIEHGDQVLLCSDGLTEMVSDEAIAAILRDGGPPAATCQRLIDAALDGGGVDNVTVVLGRFRVIETNS